MQIDALYPSKYVKSDDFPPGKRVSVVIRSVSLEDLGNGETKPALWFLNKTKAAILNKTNALILEVSLGSETDDWIGKTIELFAEQKSFQGRLVQGISMAVPAQAVAPPPDEKKGTVLGKAAKALDGLAAEIDAEAHQRDATAGDGFEDIPFNKVDGRYV